MIVSRKGIHVISEVTQTPNASLPGRFRTLCLSFMEVNFGLGPTIPRTSMAMKGPGKYKGEEQRRQP